MANEATQAKMNEILAAAKVGCEIIPAFFQPRFGRSNAVSAAIRALLKSGAIVQCGKDGMGNPKYSLAIAPANHAGNATLN